MLIYSYLRPRNHIHYLRVVFLSHLQARHDLPRLHVYAGVGACERRLEGGTRHERESPQLTHGGINRAQMFSGVGRSLTAWPCEDAGRYEQAPLRNRIRPRPLRLQGSAPVAE